MSERPSRSLRWRHAPDFPAPWFRAVCSGDQRRNPRAHDAGWRLSGGQRAEPCTRCCGMSGWRRYGRRWPPPRSRPGVVAGGAQQNGPHRRSGGGHQPDLMSRLQRAQQVLEWARAVVLPGRGRRGCRNRRRRPGGAARQAAGWASTCGLLTRTAGAADPAQRPASCSPSRAADPGWVCRRSCGRPGRRDPRPAPAGCSRSGRSDRHARPPRRCRPSREARSGLASLQVLPGRWRRRCRAHPRHRSRRPFRRPRLYRSLPVNRTDRVDQWDQAVRSGPTLRAVRSPSPQARPAGRGFPAALPPACPPALPPAGPELPLVPVRTAGPETGRPRSRRGPPSCPKPAAP